MQKAPSLIFLHLRKPQKNCFQGVKKEAFKINFWGTAKQREKELELRYFHQRNWNQCSFSEPPPHITTENQGCFSGGIERDHWPGLNGSWEVFVTPGIHMRVIGRVDVNLLSKQLICSRSRIETLEKGCIHVQI